MKKQKFKITYGTLAAPNPELHQLFDQALDNLKGNLGKAYPLFINGQECWAEETFEDRSPVNTDVVLGVFQKGTVKDAQDALAAARAASPAWKATPWQERVALMRKAADLISDRLIEISAVMSLEVGKNRLEALGDVEETADLIRWYCDEMEKNQGYITPMLSESDKHHNTSILKPHGVWAVISPFNFPFALAGGPSGGALVAGNTVVFKPATDTPFTGWLLTECMRDAGLPDGVFNFVSGPGRIVGEELINNAEVDGITFTGSYDVGMHIYRTFASGRYPRPCIAEMGGKNAAIVSSKADLDKAALGVMRSAFGLTGQKCSACSRVFVEEEVKEAFIEKLVSLAKKVAVGDPSRQEIYMGPASNKSAFEDYKRFVEILHRDGNVLVGGEVLTGGDYGRGFFVAPTVVTDLPLDHELWKVEMFLPIVVVAGVDSPEQAMALANDSDYGLTGGFFSEDKEEIQWYLDNIEAGVVYVNRAAGATTGAWPGYQPFGGWKGSGSTGKAGGSLYYVPQYMREQSQTVID
ncbi:MAG: aldehyde dehydrogenase family protein [Chloroflexota bacterium]|nr:aldehyde dehydrogenase family protein [Chloroflexota bacterium]